MDKCETVVHIGMMHMPECVMCSLKLPADIYSFFCLSVDGVSAHVCIWATGVMYVNFFLDRSNAVYSFFF